MRPSNRGTLEADASAIINLARTDTLDNFMLSDLTGAQVTLDDWKQANKAQIAAQDDYAHALQALRDVVDLINDDRRTIQAGADVLYSYKDAANGPTRRAFPAPRHPADAGVSSATFPSRRMTFDGFFVFREITAAFSSWLLRLTPACENENAPADSSAGARE